jgi:hypothetical protein
MTRLERGGSGRQRKRLAAPESSLGSKRAAGR